MHMSIKWIFINAQKKGHFHAMMQVDDIKRTTQKERHNVSVHRIAAMNHIVALIVQ